MREIRFITATELRALGNGSDTPLALEGYAAVFNSESNDLGGYTEFVKPGAFKRSLAEGADVRCLMNHDANRILGRIKAKTLDVREDSKGLWFHCDLPNTHVARDLHVSVSRGDVDQCSFAFSVEKSGQSWTEEKNAQGEWVIKRYLNDVDLADVSAVTYPAYEDTVVSARADVVPLEVRSRVEARKAEEVAAAAAVIAEASRVAAEAEASRVAAEEAERAKMDPTKMVASTNPEVALNDAKNAEAEAANKAAADKVVADAAAKAQTIANSKANVATTKAALLQAKADHMKAKADHAVVMQRSMDDIDDDGEEIDGDEEKANPTTMSAPTTVCGLGVDAPDGEMCSNEMCTRCNMMREAAKKKLDQDNAARADRLVSIFSIL